MAGPDNDMLIAALVAVGLLAVWLAVLLARRTREVRSVREIGERLDAVAQHRRPRASGSRRMPRRAVRVTWRRAPTG